MHKNRRWLLILISVFSLCGCAPGDELSETLGAPRNPNSYEEDFAGSSSAAQVRAEGTAYVVACADEVRAAMPANFRAAEPLLCRARVVEAMISRMKSTLWTNVPVTCLSKEKETASQQGYAIKLAEDGRLKVAIELGFTSKAEGARKEAMLSEVKGCIPYLREVWGRYGVDFEIGMSLYAHDPQRFNAWTVNLDDRDCRSNDSNYCMQAHKSGIPAQYANDALCSMVIHESGHLLGLIDEYNDPAKPKLPFVSAEKRPWSMMGDTWHRISVLDFYPRHLAAIFEPICPVASKRLRAGP